MVKIFVAAQAEERDVAVRWAEALVREAPGRVEIVSRWCTGPNDIIVVPSIVIRNQILAVQKADAIVLVGLLRGRTAWALAGVAQGLGKAVYVEKGEKRPLFAIDVVEVEHPRHVLKREGVL